MLSENKKQSLEILKKVKRLEIKTRKLVTEVFSGEYHSVFKGQGIEFSEVREYIPGDDIRSIDWNVTARMGHAFVKNFMEERQLNILLMVDLSASGYFGSRDQFKNEVAAEIAAVLAFSALRNNDRVGLLTFTDRIEKYLPPKSQKQYGMRIIREILYGKPQGTKTNIAQALEYAFKVTRRRCVIFLISDYMDRSIDRSFEKPLRIAAKKHDIVALEIYDAFEEAFPPHGFINLEDAESGEECFINAKNSRFRKDYGAKRSRFNEDLKKLFQSLRIDHVRIATHIPYTDSLNKLFKLRIKRLSV